jgi:UDP-N-acetylglucosamine 2-epimerase (non-hydrolysing)
MTLRENTERPITVTSGTNTIVGTDPERIMAVWERIKTEPVTTARPPLWDGQTARRIVDIVKTEFSLDASGRSG